MTGEELQVLLTLRSTLSEYEHFMTELSTMIERGVDVPPCGSAKFPMRDKLYAQVRDLVLGKSAMAAKQPIDIMTETVLQVGDRVCWVKDHKRTGVVTAAFPDSAAVLWDEEGLILPFNVSELIKL